MHTKIKIFAAFFLGLAISSVSAQDVKLDELTPQDPPAAPVKADIDPPRVDEELFVTGSYIKGLRQEDLASPLISLNRDDIKNTGATRIADLINNLTINTGSENNTDAFSQNFTTGTNSINLRGLGIGSTLVLLNGRRQTYSGFANDKGENFVDTASLVPMIALERVEILKDGAGSLYGSDAVAGVANFKTRKHFDGFEVELETQSGVDDQANNIVSLVYGFDNETTSFLAAFSHLERDAVGTDKRRLSDTDDDISRAGMPGTFLLPVVTPASSLYPTWSALFDQNPNFIADFFEPLIGAPEVTGALQPAYTDPDCANLAARDNTTIVPATFPIGPCQLDFGSFFTVVPEEENEKFYFNLEQQLPGSMNLYFEYSQASFEATRRASPSFPITSTPRICGVGTLDGLLGEVYPDLGRTCAELNAASGNPTGHPDNPFGVDVLFIGRALGSGQQATLTQFESDTDRFVIGIDGALSDSWDWSVDFTNSSNEYVVQTDDTLKEEFLSSLAGLGGNGCNPTTGIPGQGPCEYFNPFGSSLTGTGSSNSSAIIDYITGRFKLEAESELQTLGAVFSGEVFELGGGTAKLATGVQLRDESLKYDYDEHSNNENFLFTIGNPDFTTDRDIKAAFVELAMPLTDTFNLQLSARYEDYDVSGDSVDPKVAVLFRPNNNISIRSSFTTSFRAPSLFQQNGVRITLEEISVPTLGTQFIPVRSQPNPNNTLKPEEADIFNLGFSWLSDSEAFSLNADYWSYDYTNVIIQQNPQAVLNSALAGDTVAASQVKMPTGTIERITVFYDNASSLETDGLDLQTSYEWLIDEHHIRLGMELTKVLSYDLVDPLAGKIDGLGKRNANNFATSVPELRANINLHWSTAKQSVNLYWRHIDSYVNDQLNAATNSPRNEEISSHTTIDLQYRYRFDVMGNADKGIELSVGAINLTDEDPPHVNTNGGLDSKVHDPRGQIYYLNANVPF